MSGQGLRVPGGGRKQVSTPLTTLLWLGARGTRRRSARPGHLAQRAGGFQLNAAKLNARFAACSTNVSRRSLRRLY